MRIAQVAVPFESVPPAGYGGTERVVATQCNQLVRRGHDVALFAAGESCTSATLVPMVEQALWHCEPERSHEAVVRDLHNDDIPPGGRLVSTNRPTGKRELIDTMPASSGGSRYVRRDAQGRFTADQVDVGRSQTADRRQHAKHKAPKGMKDRGD
jgi:hypothetical protein